MGATDEDHEAAVRADEFDSVISHRLSTIAIDSKVTERMNAPTDERRDSEALECREAAARMLLRWMLSIFALHRRSSADRKSGIATDGSSPLKRESCTWNLLSNAAYDYCGPHLVFCTFWWSDNTSDTTDSGTRL